MDIITQHCSQNFELLYSVELRSRENTCLHTFFFNSAISFSSFEKSYKPVSSIPFRKSQSSRSVAMSSRGQSSKVTLNSLKKSPGSSHSISSQYGEADIDQYDSQSSTSAR